MQKALQQTESAFLLRHSARQMPRSKRQNTEPSLSSMNTKSPEKLTRLLRRLSKRLKKRVWKSALLPANMQTICSLVLREISTRLTTELSPAETNLNNLSLKCLYVINVGTFLLNERRIYYELSCNMLDWGYGGTYSD